MAGKGRVRLLAARRRLALGLPARRRRLALGRWRRGGGILRLGRGRVLGGVLVALGLAGGGAVTDRSRKFGNLFFTRFNRRNSVGIFGRIDSRNVASNAVAVF